MRMTLLLVAATAACTSAPASALRPVHVVYAVDTCSRLGDERGLPASLAPGGVLITSRDELRAKGGCNARFDAAHDFGASWLAKFSVTTHGDRLRVLGLHDDGETLTLDLEVSFYCGGVSPGTSVQTFFFGVPRAERALAIHLNPADQPPCPRNLP